MDGTIERTMLWDDARLVERHCPNCHVLSKRTVETHCRRDGGKVGEMRGDCGGAERKYRGLAWIGEDVEGRVLIILAQ